MQRLLHGMCQWRLAHGRVWGTPADAANCQARLGYTPGMETSMRTPFLALLATACSLTPLATDKDADTDVVAHTDGVDTDGTTDTDGTADTDRTAALSEAETIARAMIAGTRDPAEGLKAVAWLEEGWPVRTSSGAWLFVHVADGGTWSWAGDANAWEPAAMTPGAHGTWWIEVTIPDPAGSAYKFVRDGTDWQSDLFSRSYDFDGFGRFSYVRPPTDAPHLERWPKLSATGLADRDLRVFVPAGAGPWPVLYLQDGQNLFDPDALFGGWKLREAMVADGRDALLVGMDHGGAARLDEYGHTTDTRDGVPIGGKGDLYADLVHDVIRPHVEATYATTGLAGVMGSSMGGLISLHIALRDPGDWDFVGSLSGALWFGRHELANPTMQELWQAAGHVGVAVYVDSGGGDGGDGCTDPDMDGFAEDDPNDSDGYCMSRSFADTLAGGGFVWDTDLWHWHEPGAQHNEAAWAARVGRPLGLFLDLAAP